MRHRRRSLVGVVPREPVWPRATLTVPPRLFLRRPGPRVRETTRGAPNSWAQRRIGRAASVMSQAVSSRPDRAQEHRGELAERRCRVDRRGCLSAPPRSTFRANVQPIMAGRRAALRVGGTGSVLSLAHWAARTGSRPMSARLLVAAPFRLRRLRHLPASIFPVGRSAQASRRASGARLPSQQRRLSRRSAALDLPSGHIADHGGPRGPRATLAASPRFVRRRSLTAQTAGNRMAAELPNAAPRGANLPRPSPGGISPLRLDGGQGRRTRWATWLPSQARLC